MIELIKPHRELLCFFAQATGYRECVLGLDFDAYDPRASSLPVYVMNKQMARVVARVEGRAFKRALNSIRAGRNVIVTFTSPTLSGWFKMRWQLGETRTFAL
jgi:hypothetical protein